jgi:hypothetical protein
MRALVFLDLRDALPALVLIAVALIASALLDDALTFLLVVGLAVALVVAGYRYGEAGQRGARRRELRARFDELLDPTERRVRQVARTLPLCVALVLGVVAGRGWLDGIVFGAAAAVGFVAAQMIFAVWLNARHSGPEPFG